MMRAAVLGSPISHSLSPLLHESAYQILKFEGEYEAIEVSSLELNSFLTAELHTEMSAVGDDRAHRGFNLTMPLKESIFEFDRCSFDSVSARIKSANTIIREGASFLATSTDTTAIARLLEGCDVTRVAIIGGGGTARAAVGAISNRTKEIDILLRTQSRIDALAQIAPQAALKSLPMDSDLSGYDLVINTTPAGVADHLSREIGNGGGVLLESLYKPWPTELSFAWRELGGRVINGLDLLVEQALDAIALMTEVSFDYSPMRQELLRVAYTAVDSQNAKED